MIRCNKMCACSGMLIFIDNIPVRQRCTVNKFFLGSLSANLYMLMIITAPALPYNDDLSAIKLFRDTELLYYDQLKFPLVFLSFCLCFSFSLLSGNWMLMNLICQECCAELNFRQLQHILVKRLCGYALMWNHSHRCTITLISVY